VGIAHRFSEQISTILSGSARPTSLFLNDNCRLQTASFSSWQLTDAQAQQAENKKARQ